MFRLLKYAGAIVPKRGALRIAVAAATYGGTVSVGAPEERKPLLEIAVAVDAAPVGDLRRSGVGVCHVPAADVPDYPGWYTVAAHETRWTSTRKVCLYYA